MSIEDEVRKYAETCRVMAAASTKVTDRVFWLMLAQDWQMLAQDLEAEPPEEREQIEARLAASLLRSR